MPRNVSYDEVENRVRALSGEENLFHVDANLFFEYFKDWQRRAISSVAWPDSSFIGHRWPVDRFGKVPNNPSDHLKHRLIFWLEMDEAAGAARTDAHNSKSFTDNNTIGKADGAVGYAGDFTSASSMFAELADEADTSTGDIDFSVACCFRMTTKSADMVMLSKSDSASVREYELYYDTSRDQVAWEVFDSSGTSIGSVYVDAAGLDPTATADRLPFEINTWYQVVAYHARNGNQVGIGLNSFNFITEATTGEPSDTAANVRVGARYSTEQDFFNGRLDSLGFWKRKLTEGDKDRLYREGNFNDYPFELTKIGDVFQIYADDPLGSWGYAAGLAGYIPHPQGWQILSGQSDVYLHYREERPEYDATVYSSTETVAARTVRFQTTDKRFYSSKVSHSGEAPPDVAFWEEVETPWTTFNYVTRGIFSDLLMAEGRFELAGRHRTIAEHELETDLEVLERQQKLYQPTQFTTHRSAYVSA